MKVAAADLAGLTRSAVASHERMLALASRMSDEDCRAPSLLPGWSRGHVLAHWSRSADGQTRMLTAAMRGEVAAQYPGGDAQRAADIETGAARPARLILDGPRCVRSGRQPLRPALSAAAAAPMVVKRTPAGI